ncbi:hypothetical protein PG994_014438 [Apiospora phragmitis]|uniref:Uncharacterized protein n=1 Tax=Apiospora phragmitis TaxID=2905665 RepID=A0ABR1T4B9_9PEZI
MASELQHTLWLWLGGFFPRRVWYYLLTKGLVASPADLLEGKTAESSLRINRMHMDMAGGGWKFADPSNPAPPGASTPCLGIHDLVTGETSYIYESASILLPRDHPIDVAIMHDIIGVTNLATLDSGYYTRHAVPVLSAWFGVANEDRSRAAALNARAGMAKNLGKEGGRAWPTSVSRRRVYLELTFGWDIFEGGEELKELAAWYERFKALGWWEAAEEHTIVHPPQLRLGRECRSSDGW